MKIFYDIDQGSERWFKLRTGKPTASDFDKIITPGGKPSGQLKKYSIELVAKCLLPDNSKRAPGATDGQLLAKLVTPTGKDSAAWTEVADDLIAEEIRPDQSVSFDGNADTDRGTELEPEARETFSKLTKLEVTQVGFVTRDDRIVGCSPDGLIFEDGKPVAGLEIKCPRAKYHGRYFLGGGLPSAYAPQVHGSMAVTGLNHWYFISYCQGMTPFITRVDRDAYTELVAASLDDFLIEYQKSWAELNDRMKDIQQRFASYYEARREAVMPLLEGKEEEKPEPETADLL